MFLLIKLHKIAGNIMGYLEAFDGSKAALDSDKILIVRGRSRKRINAENMAEELNGVMETLNAREIEMYSDESTALIGLMDEQIRSTVDINVETDAGGIEHLKESLESMNFFVDYKLGSTGKAGFFVVIWKDKSDVGPCFVEIVISDTGE
ncbi:MAG TPA: DUF2120 domain-containing protein [Methanobacteriaceae archaeon]|nr:DUF2120 domain-containing protein [Methanobacteriaceae archaeon]